MMDDPVLGFRFQERKGGTDPGQIPDTTFRQMASDTGPNRSGTLQHASPKGGIVTVFLR